MFVHLGSPETEYNWYICHPSSYRKTCIHMAQIEVDIFDNK